MAELDFKVTVRGICARDTRYPQEAYTFVREALDFTVKALNRPAGNQPRHVTGPELLDGIREYAIHEFGPMASTVFKSWGIGKTEDFGEIVFNLVESGILGKTETDKKEDFSNGYDFFNAFVKPFLPASEEPQIKTRRKPPSAKRRRTKQ